MVVKLGFIASKHIWGYRLGPYFKSILMGSGTMSIGRLTAFVVIATASLVFGSSQAKAQSSLGPKYFIANQLGPACLKNAQGSGRSQAKARQALNALYSNNQRYIDALLQSTALSISKGGFEDPWEVILFNSYAAAAANDAPLARTIIDGMKNLALGRRYQSEPRLLTVRQAKSSCYGSGPNSRCPRHQPRMVARMYANLMISAAVLKPFMTKEDRDVLIPWFKAGYKNFVSPEAKSETGGIYDFGNMGAAILAYASLTNDKSLARRELSSRKRIFLKHIEKTGYIDENSFRGVRGFWYHTYGLDAALSYALIARAWGSDYFRDPKLGPRLFSAVKLTSLGITNHPQFRAVGNRGSSYSNDPNDARTHVHQMALNLYTIAAREYGVRLPPSGRHNQLKRYEAYPKMSGVWAPCYYSSR